MTMPHRGDKPDKTKDNVGAPLELTEVKIVDRKTGNTTKIGEQGMIHLLMIKNKFLIFFA